MRRIRSTCGLSTARFPFNERTPGIRRRMRIAQAHIRPASSGAGDLADLVDLDQIAFLDVVVVGEAETALEALRDLPDVVLEATQRVDAAVVDDHAVPQEAGTGSTLDHAFRDVATGHASCTRDPENGPHLGRAEHDLLLVRCQLAHEELFDFVEQLVDDPVGPDLDTELFRPAASTRLGTDVEADDDRLGHIGQVDVVLVDATDSPVGDLDAAAFAGDLSDRLP